VNTVFDILPETIRVLIGDDHRIVREGLKQILADAPDVQVVCEAQTGAQVMAEVQNLGGLLGLDLVLLDIAMPGMDGLDVLQALKREYPRLPVLMLSTYPEKQYAVRCIRLGACGYLNKSADPDDMLAAVRKAAGGGVFLSQATAEASPRQWAAPRHRAVPKRCRTASTRSTICLPRAAP